MLRWNLNNNLRKNKPSYRTGVLSLKTVKNENEGLTPFEGALV